MEQRPNLRDVWRNRPIVALAACQVVESFATWGSTTLLLAALALAWGGTAALGVVCAMTVLPHIALGPIAGSLLDRVCRRNTLIVTNVARGVVLFSMLLYVGSTVSLYLAALALAVGQLAGLVARGALVQSLVKRDELQVANSALNGATTIGRIIGPPVMGMVLDSAGVATAYVVLGLAFLAAGLAMLVVPRVHVAPAKARLVERSLDGLRHSFTSPLPRMLIISSFVFLLGGGLLNLLELLLATDVLNSGATGYGFMLSLYSVGSLVGAMLAARVKGSRSLASVLTGSVTMGLFVAMLAWARNLPLALILVACAGAAETLRTISTVSLFQAWTPEDKITWTLGMYAAISAGGMATAYLAGPAVLQRLAVGPALLVAGTIITASALVAVTLKRGVPTGLSAPRLTGAPGSADKAGATCLGEEH